MLPHTLEGARSYRLHVSTDWAPGSSGAPMLDGRGNVVGHVAVISALQGKSRQFAGRPTPDPSEAPRDEPPQDQGDTEPIPPAAASVRLPGPTMITLHEGVPARGI